MNDHTVSQDRFRFGMDNWIAQAGDASLSAFAAYKAEFHAAWYAGTHLLVVHIAYEGRLGRLFLQGWNHCIRWATDWTGQPDIMPCAMDPGLPVLEETVSWAKPWRESIPLDVRLILQPFVTERWALLHWSSRSPAALELLRSAPTLLWLLLVTAELADWSEAQILQLLGRKRRAILADCGLYPATATLKLLAKFHAPAYGRQTYA